MTSNYDYQSDNIIHGSAELPAIRTDQGVCWVLPGLGVECCRESAERFAVRLDKTIQRNLRKFSRKLFR